MTSLAGKTALVLGIANDHSIAYGCAKAFADAGARLAVTYLNAKAEPHVRPLAEKLGAELILPLDGSDDSAIDAVFDEVRNKFGTLDTILHSIAFCPKEDLHARVVDCSRDGFSKAMDISVHSFLRMCQKAEPLMTQGGTCLTVTFHGSQRVVGHYNIMGPVKAALESSVRYLARDLGSKNITVHSLSPGPLQTRAASGIDGFDDMVAEAIRQAPTHRLATVEEVGAFAAFLAGPNARNLTGGNHYIDGGYNIID